MKKLYALVFSALLIAACQEDEPFPDNNLHKEPLFQTTENSSSKRHLTIVNSPAIIAPTQATDLNTEDEYNWTYVANVEPLEVSDIELSATSIALSESTAYVTYHKRGNVHMGALEFIDLSNPDEPESLGFIPFDGYDINAVTLDPYETNVVWVAGSSNKIGATLFKLNLTATYQLESYERINLSKALSGISASANGIHVTNNYILVSAGRSFGGIIKIDRYDLSNMQATEFSGAKGVSGSSVRDIEYYASLAVDNQTEISIKQVESENLQLVYNTSTSHHQSVDLPRDGKYELVFSPVDSTELYFTAGSQGVRSVNILTGETIKETEVSLLPNGNTNSLSIDNQFIYLANGEDGVNIALREDAERTGIITPIFHWDLPVKPASVNFVTAQNGYVFVAKGLGGFHVLKYEKQFKTVLPYDDQGTPVGMVQRDYCPELITTMLVDVLAEGENALESHPEYFQNPNSSFYLEQDAQVEVTFLHEGAGYRNVLGYYTYNANNPPSSIADLEKTVIFPNTSARYSGGNLIPGNTVEVLGTFPAGTVFGFFINSNGWKNKITDGHAQQYSDWEFNARGNQQNLIFYDEDCDAFVLCFEDVTIPGGDKDFNDAIFQVTSSPSEAFRKTAYLQVRQD